MLHICYGRSHCCRSTAQLPDRALPDCASDRTRPLGHRRPRLGANSTWVRRQ